MATRSIPSLLADLQLLGGEQVAIVEAVRAQVKKLWPAATEEVKYGGILFSAEGVTFGGVFAYRQHVSVEFGQGARIQDTHGLLEGSGKGRRHLKLRTPQDLLDRQLAHYLPLALQAAQSTNGAG